MTRPIIATALALCFLLSTHSFSQTSNATLGGIVSDTTNALIPGVTITASNTQTGIVTTVVTNESGAYQFANLQTGTYKVSAELPGFRTQTYSDVTLGVSQQVRLNFTLQVGSVAQSVEVTVAADTLLATSSSSVGTVLPESKVRDLPLGGRNVMDLVLKSAGTGPIVATARAGETDQGYFAGGRLSAVNTTRDGFVVSDGRYNHGAFSATYTSPDLVEEVRVVTSPVDAEMGRGSGQVQMVTRSGTNQFRGSVFWTNRNSALDASNWFNNFNGVRKDYQNRNQFGGRFGGPIIKNKTFFFVLMDEQRNLIRQTFVGTVLTPLARQGIFRFFPNADNQNATSNNPTVDRSGNPVRPASATGDLQSFNVFQFPDGRPRDTFRTGFDPSGFVQNTWLSRMPMPNDYTTGDGLNTAGIRFSRRIYGLDQPDGNGVDTNRDQFNMRIDHQFNTNNKLSVVYTYERNIDNSFQAGIMQWPDGFNGRNNRWPKIYTGSLVSTLSSTLVNELRVAKKVGRQFSWAPMYVGRNNESEETGPEGAEAFKLVPKNNGVPYTPIMLLSTENFMNWSSNAGASRWTISPSYQLGDNISWTAGKHAFKTGAEWRYNRTSSGNDSNITPQAILGVGGPAVQNLDNVVIPGLSGNNQTTARNILTDLSGSLTSIVEGFDLRSSKDPAFIGYKDGVKYKLRDWRAQEFSAFFKDDWKALPGLTLNLGVHWEWYGPPYEAHGLAGRPVGGDTGLCGISCGALTSAEFVGKNSPHPNTPLYNNDWNNFAPSVGLAWSLPWFGKDKTVLRAGYGLSYAGGPLKGASTDINFVSGGFPGTFEGFSNTGVTYTTANYLSLANITLPIPHQFAPLQSSRLDASRSETAQAYSVHRVNPYIQNFNVSIQRELARTLTVNVSYVGTKGTRLFGGVPLNATDIFKNKFLDAFNVTRTGGNAALFDQMLMGLNVPGAGMVNGTTVTGSAALRAYTATRAFIANGNVGQLADFLNRSTNITGKGGGFVRNGGLAENFFVLNPQFQIVTLQSNPDNSTYHSLELQMTKRLSNGFTNQTTYTWSRALGVNDGDGLYSPRDPNNRALDKAVLGYHRTHNFISNGTFELPFGPNRKFLANSGGLVRHLTERWQFGAIFSWTSGPPLTVVAPVSSIWQNITPTTNNTPMVVGDFPKNIGKVTKLSNGVTYFPGFQQVTDPSASSVSSLNGLSGTFSNKAIVDSQGRLVLVNPAPGQIGNLGRNTIEGPALLGFDANLIKRVRITETKEFEFRVDTINVLNHPNFDVPNVNINSTGSGIATAPGATVTGPGGTSAPFGRITSAAGERRFVISGRLNF